MSGFLKPKKWDPDHARRTMEEEQQRHDEKAAKIKAEQEQAHSMKLALGLTEKEHFDDVDSLPSASDTSDEEDSETEFVCVYEERATCPMRQYELLQRRYLRAMQELHESGARERNNEGLLVKLKLMSKQQTAILKRSMHDQTEAKDQLITTMMSTMRQLKIESSVIETFENTHKDIAGSGGGHLSISSKADSSSTSSNSSTNNDKEEKDVLHVSLTKAEACNRSLEAENNALRRSLQDLGNEDPSSLVTLQEQVRETKNEMKELQSMLEIMKVERDEYEKLADTVATNGGGDDGGGAGGGGGGGVEGDGAAGGAESATEVEKQSKKKSRNRTNEQKLLKELKKMASKVKKLEAGKMALMNILKEAQNELAKRKSAPSSLSGETSDFREGADRGKERRGEEDVEKNSTAATTAAATTAAAAAAALVKKDKTIKKLKSQVKQLTNLLREVEAQRQQQSELSSSSVSSKDASADAATAAQAAATQAATQRINILESELQVTKETLAQHQHDQTTTTASFEVVKENYENKVAELCQSLAALKAEKVAMSKDQSEKKIMMDQLRRQTKEREHSLQKKISSLERKLETTKRSKSSLKDKLLVLNKQVVMLSTESKESKIQIQKMLSTIPIEIALVSEQLSKRMSKQLATFQGLADKYKREYRERKRLFNIVQELRGNIRVFCRVRPISSEESKNGNIEIINYPKDEENELILTKKDGRLSKFEFDQVFKAGSTNVDVFQGVQDLCMSVLDGFNVCIFA